MMKTSKFSLQIVDWNKYDPNASECSAQWAPIEDIKVRFCQKILMFLSYLQTDEHFIFLNLKIWTLVAENCLEIEDVLKFESLEDGKGKKTAFGWLDEP